MSFALDEVLQLLGRQSAAIDRGDGQNWAATFSDDGVFDSPSYNAPVRGRDELTRFAARFQHETPGGRHVITNTYLAAQTEDSALAHSYLMIIRNGTELVRAVTVTDELTKTHGQIVVRRRTVTL